MTLATQIHVPLHVAEGDRPSSVVAAIDGSGVSAGVRVVADRMATHLGVPMREFYLPAASPPGPTAVVPSRVAHPKTAVPDAVSVLSAKAQTPFWALLVLGAPADPRRSWRWDTTLRIARQVTRPVLVVPRTLDAWEGPRQVLVPLDGTSPTAFCASRAVLDLGLSMVTTTPAHVFDEKTVPRFWDHPEHEYEAWSREFQARYVDEALEDGFVVRAGPRSAGTNIVDLAAHYGFDMVIAVWSQLAPGTNAPIVLRLLAESPIPVLLVPSLATRAAAELEPEEDRAAG